MAILTKVDSLHVPAIKIYRVEAVGLSLSNFIFKIIIFVCMFQFGAILQKKKNYILSITT